MDYKAKSPFVRVIVGLVVSASFSAATAAQAEIFEGYPDAIVCRSADRQVVVYIDVIKDDGSAIYKTLGNDVAQVTPDHVFHRLNAKDCDGKTLEQLKQEGKTRELN
jgi:hypothetical protein